MSVTLDTTRYTDRKQHDCGCITVWDTLGGQGHGECRYTKACGAHRPYWVAVLYAKNQARHIKEVSDGTDKA